MSSFRITSVPAGAAPDWVREQWVGLILPLQARSSWDSTTDAVGGLPDGANDEGYTTLAATALDILRQSGPEGERAAEWWERFSTLSILPDAGLTFGKNFCELLEYKTPNPRTREPDWSPGGQAISS